MATQDMIRTIALLAALSIATPVVGEDLNGKVTDVDGDLVLDSRRGKFPLTNLSEEHDLVLQAFVAGGQTAHVSGSETSAGTFDVEAIRYLVRARVRYQICEFADRLVARPSYKETFLRVLGRRDLARLAVDRLVEVDGYITPTHLVVLAVKVRPSRWSWSQEAADGEAIEGAKTGLLGAWSGDFWATRRVGEQVEVVTLNGETSRGFVPSAEMRWGANLSLADRRKGLVAAFKDRQEATNKLVKSLGGLSRSLGGLNESLEGLNESLDAVNERAQAD